MDLSFLRPQKTFAQKLRVVLTGGGSGGHTFPLIAVERELKKQANRQNIQLEIMYLGPADFTVPYLVREGITIKTIKAGKLRREWSFSESGGFFNTLAGLFQAMWHLYFFMPDFIFSKGGYGSFPVTFWGFLFFIPTYIHESDSIPGLANRLAGKFAKKVFLSFESSGRYFPAAKTILTGNPIREDIFLESYDPQATKKLLGLSERPLVTIIGGSQGSQHINDFILDILPKLLERLEIIHQVGTNNFSQVQKELEIIFQEIVKNAELQQYYHPVPFLEESTTPSLNSLKDVLLISDLIIARAGSGLIFEIAASSKPAIIIPLPWAAQDHQKQNAYEYAKSGAAIVVEEQNLKPNLFSDLIFRLLDNKEKLAAMRQAAQAFAKPKAAEQIAQYLLQETQNLITNF